jgi:hypothetical protein
MVQWKEQPTAACPRCGDDENARHVWLCQEPAMFFVWALLMYSLSAYLESIHTVTEIIFWIIRCLTEWRSQEPLSPIRTDLPGLRQAIEAQDSIGWQGWRSRHPLSLAWPSEHWQTLGNFSCRQTMGSSVGPLGSSKPGQIQPRDGPRYRSA